MRHPVTGNGMPEWLRRTLVDKGVLSHQGLTAKARIVTHRPCGFPTLAGFDDHVAALDAWCDLGQLSPEGELLALLDGRRTYRLWDGRDLRRRDRWNIPGHPASHQVAVFAEHRCHHPIPASWCQPPTRRSVATADEGILF